MSPNPSNIEREEVDSDLSLQGRDDEDLVVSGVTTVVKQVKKHGAVVTIIVAITGAVGTGVWQGTSAILTFVSDKCVAPVVEQQVSYLKEQREALQSFKKAVESQSQLLGSLDKNLERMNGMLDETHKDLEKNGKQLEALIDRSTHGAADK